MLQRVGQEGGTLPSLCPAALGAHPQAARAGAGENTHGSSPERGCAEHQDWGKGWGGGTPSPPPGTACAFLGREPGEAEPSLHTHGVRHHHHINNERAAPSKLFVPAPARAQNAEEEREPHPKQPWESPDGPLLVLCCSFAGPTPGH